MRKIFLFISFILCFVFSYSQPIVNRSSAIQTVQDQRLSAALNLYIPRYLDTTVANITGNIGIDSCGAIIFTYINNSYWKRNCSPKKWEKISDQSDLVDIVGCNSLLTGGLVSVNNGLVLDVTKATYYIGCSPYNSPTLQVTLSAAHVSFGRFDVIYVNTSGAVGVVTGTPSASPVIPQINPITQLALTSVFIPAGATTIGGGYNSITIYDENIEWTSGSTLTSGSVNFNNLVNPYHLVKSALTASGTGGNIYWDTTGVLNTYDYSLIKLFVRPNLSFVSASSNYFVYLRYGSAQTTFGVSLLDYGFDPNNFGSYQTITIPIADFPFYNHTTQGQFQGFGFQMTSGSPVLNIDWIQLQGGISNGMSPYLTDVYAIEDTLYKVINGISFPVDTISGGGGGASFYLHPVIGPMNFGQIAKQIGSSDTVFIKSVGASFNGVPATLEITDSTLMLLLTGSGSGIAIGDPVTGGTENLVLFIDDNGDLAQDAQFNYHQPLGRLTASMFRGDTVTSDVIIVNGDDNVAFRGVRFTAWDDNQFGQFFQVGNTNDNIMFTTASGATATRIGMFTDKFQISRSSYITTSAPTGVFEVINDANTKILDLTNAGLLTVPNLTLTNLSNGGVAADSVMVITSAGVVKKRNASSFSGGGGTISLYHQVWVDTLGNDGTGMVGSPSTPYRTINAALDATAGYANVVINIGIGRFDSVTSTKLRANLWLKGSQMPELNNHDTATSLTNVVRTWPTALQNGTIINGGLIFVNLVQMDNITITDLGVDLGKTWILNGHARGDGLSIRFSTTGMNSVHPPHVMAKNVRVENFVSLLDTSTSPYHAMTGENLTMPYFNNTVSAGGVHGYAFKCDGGFFNNHTSYSCGTTGMTFKNNNYATGNKMIVNNWRVTSFNAIDGQGLAYQNETTDDYRQGVLGQFIVTNGIADRVVNGIFMNGSDVDINFLSFANITISNTTQSGVDARRINKSTFDNIKVSKAGGNGIDIRSGSVGFNSVSNSYADSCAYAGGHFETNNLPLFVNNLIARRNTFWGGGSGVEFTGTNGRFYSSYVDSNYYNFDGVAYTDGNTVLTRAINTTNGQYKDAADSLTREPDISLASTGGTNKVAFLTPDGKFFASAFTASSFGGGGGGGGLPADSVWTPYQLNTFTGTIPVPKLGTINTRQWGQYWNNVQIIKFDSTKGGSVHVFPGGVDAIFTVSPYGYSESDPFFKIGDFGQSEYGVRIGRDASFSVPRLRLIGSNGEWIRGGNNGSDVYWAVGTTTGSFYQARDTTNEYNSLPFYYSGRRVFKNNVGFGINTLSMPTAKIEIAAGTATASTAPLKFTSGTNLTTAEAGAMEFDGTNFYLSPSTTRKRIPLSNNATPSNGQLLIGNGTDYTVASLASSGGTITYTAGSGTLNLEVTNPVNPTQTYTPTITNGTNVAASTAYTTQYQVIGDRCYVWGEIDIDATLALTLSHLTFDIPVSTASSNSYNMAGTGAFRDNTIVQISINTGAVNFDFTPQTATNNKYSFHFSYLITPP